jgi:drug/metabolite transporter (DMT)-like permease
MVALGLALGASVAWGGSDFLAGLASRRRSVLDVLAASQAAGLVLMLALLAVSHRPPPGSGALLPAMAAGVADVVGFAALYRALAVGRMSVVAPLSSLAAVVPLVVALAGGERHSTGAAAGIVVALAGGVLVALDRDPQVGGRRAAPGVALAVIAALAFGGFFTAMDAAADAGGVAWAMALNRATSFALLAVVFAVARRGLRCRARELRAAGVAGALDATATAIFALALTEGLASTVSVVGSMYPVTTVALGAVVLHERPRAAQAGGVAAVLAGIGLLTVTGGA